ncbi:hypothetical protein K1719_046204 [Acacia pycnantha]|nr:hypothetical protein K1719_046204 [Acacia pycnantha]
MELVSKKASSSIPLSAEEDDFLVRSSKKSKNGGSAINDEEWPRLSQSDAENDDCEPLCTITEDPGRNFPKFSFSEKMKKRLYKAWNKAVIVKLLGRDIGYKLLLSILQSIWAKKGVISLINIGNDFFVVKFTNKDDYVNALTGGPWMIFDHYMTVRPWEPQFHPWKAKIDKSVRDVPKNDVGKKDGSVVMESSLVDKLGDAGVWRVVQKPKRINKGKGKVAGGKTNEVDMVGGVGGSVGTRKDKRSKEMFKKAMTDDGVLRITDGTIVGEVHMVGPDLEVGDSEMVEETPVEDMPVGGGPQAFLS